MNKPPKITPKVDLQPAGSPDVLKALTLRLETQLWLVSKRNFTRLQAILLGFHPPTGHPTPLLRVSRAACIRDVCRNDPHRATELVQGIQVGVLPVFGRLSVIKMFLSESGRAGGIRVACLMVWEN